MGFVLGAVWVISASLNWPSRESASTFSDQKARLCREPFAYDAGALAGVISRLWEIGDIVDVLESWECSK
jgi:hypothetical protein